VPIHNIVYYQCEHFLLDGEVDNVKVFKGRAITTEMEKEQLKKYKRNKELLHFYMKDGSEIKGRLQWYEDYVYAVRPEDGNRDYMITKRQILYYKKIEVN
jgi:sRNA-binding regulator protein Hfq